MNRHAIHAFILSALAACTTDPGAPVGAVEFGPPPEGMVAARPLEIDGRIIKADLSRTAYMVESGVHRIMLTPVGWESSVQGEQPPAVTVSVAVEPGMRQFIALRKVGGDAWEAVSWKSEPL